MKAIRASNGEVEVVEVAPPRGEGVRVRVRSVGICGSDLHLLESGFPLAGILGHEIAGETADGTAVAIEPIVPCGACDGCRRGDYNLCTEGAGVFIGTGRDGGMAEEMQVPERCLVPLPASIPVADACVIEPLAVGLHAVRRSRLEPGERAAVIGGGTIGLCTVASAVATGASVDLESRYDQQREVGERLGAGEPGDGYDLCFEASGTNEGFARASALCRPGGRVVLVGTFWHGCEMPAMELTMKEVDVVPASAYSGAGAIRDIDVATTLLARSPEIAKSLITHRYPLEAAPEAFRMAARRSEGAIKVVLEP